MERVIIPREGALHLLHALLDDAAEVADCRYLVIKGRSSAFHRLRARLLSADVDALVAPASLERLGQELTRRGWVERPEDADTTAFPRHSVTFFHPNWPCDLDIHFRFPGLEGDPAEVFETLYSRHSTFVKCGRRITHPCAEDALIIAALHSLRSPSLTRQQNEYAELIAAGRRYDPAVVVSHAESLQATACAAPFLRAAYGQRAYLRTELKPSAEWVLRTSLATPNARRLALLLRAPANEKMRILRHALIPDRATLLKNNIHATPSPSRLAFALVRRWIRGLSQTGRSFRHARRFLKRRWGVDAIQPTLSTAKDFA